MLQQLIKTDECQTSDQNNGHLFAYESKTKFGNN